MALLHKFTPINLIIQESGTLENTPPTYNAIGSVALRWESNPEKAKGSTIEVLGDTTIASPAVHAESYRSVITLNPAKIAIFTLLMEGTPGGLSISDLQKHKIPPTKSTGRTMPLYEMAELMEGLNGLTSPGKADIIYRSRLGRQNKTAKWLLHPLTTIIDRRAEDILL